MEAPRVPRNRRRVVALAVLTLAAIAALPAVLDDGGDTRTVTAAGRGAEDPRLPFEPPTTSSSGPVPAPSMATSAPRPPVPSSVTSTTRRPRPTSSTSTSAPSSTTTTERKEPGTVDPGAGVTTTAISACPQPPTSASRTLSDPGLYVVPIDGGAPRRLRIGIHEPVYAVFSPDGKRVVFRGTPTGWELYSGSADGKELQRLDLDPSQVADLSWSPDGQSLAFFKRSNTFDVPNSLWVMAPDGSQLRKVFDYPPNTGAIRAPRWSPDSSRLLAWGGGVWIIDVATATNRQVLTGPLFTAAWLADSRRVVADPWGPVTYHPDGTSSHQSSVEVIDAVTGARRQIQFGGVVYTTTPSSDVVIGSPLVISDTGKQRPYKFEGIARSFAPDGRHLATEDADTVFVYDENWCGQPLVDVTGPSSHWLGWAGPSAMLVNVNPQVG